MWISAVALALAISLLYVLRQQLRTSNSPPGPKPLPLVGNLFDMPRRNPWETFSRWSNTYGDIVYLNILGRPIILLNTLEATSDLMEKRFAIYSDRPQFPLAELIGHSWNFGFMPYGKRWQFLRKVFSSQYTTPTALRDFHGSHQATVAMFLQNILHDPHGFSKHIRLRAGQLLLDVTYGIHVESAAHPLVCTAEAVMGAIALALSPKMWLVNPVAITSMISTLRGIKRWRVDLEDLRHTAFNLVKHALRDHDGSAKASFVTRLLEEEGHENDASWEDLVRDSAAIAFGAGYETTTTAAEVFLLAITLYPEVQKIAQEEIDRVVGSHRLPTFEDRDRLPYLSAIMKETLRWHPPAPTGIPHLLRQDDVYRGFHLPAGSIVMGNVWGMLHNPLMYPEPDRFDPSRYISPDGAFDCTANDPSRIVFGFGRRVCPGKLFSEDSLWLMIAQFLAVYSVSLSEDMPTPRVAFVPDAISRPEPFQCLIEPRSEAARTLILESAVY